MHYRPQARAPIADILAAADMLLSQPAATADRLRAHPHWRAYLAATLRLRRCRETAPKWLANERFSRVLALEARIMRETDTPASAPLFRAAEADCDAILRRYRRGPP